jgi:hypothetical protein
MHSENGSYELTKLTSDEYTRQVRVKLDVVAILLGLEESNYI